jgi:hypothetical protein
LSQPATTLKPVLLVVTAHLLSKAKIKSGLMPALPQARDFDFNYFDFLL